MTIKINPLAQRRGIFFIDCLNRCLHEPELVAQWERLSGRQLIAHSPLERMIDEATGYQMDAMREFADFVYEYVFCTF